MAAYPIWIVRIPKLAKPWLRATQDGRVLIGIGGVQNAGLMGFRSVPNYNFEPFHALGRPEGARGPLSVQTTIIVRLLLFEAMV